MLAAAGGHSGLVDILCQLGASLDMVDSQVGPISAPRKACNAFSGENGQFSIARRKIHTLKKELRKMIGPPQIPVCN